MPKRYQNAIRFTPSKRRRVEAEFTGAEVTANGGTALQAAVGRDAQLASPSTLCRFERKSTPAEALVALHGDRVAKPDNLLVLKPDISICC